VVLDRDRNVGTDAAAGDAAAGDAAAAVAAGEAAALIAAASSIDLHIPRTMRALVKVRPEAGAELREVPVPRPGPGEILIRLEAVSLCGTDLHIYRWDPWAQGRLGKYLPRIFGHEMAGRVVAHGPGTGAVPLGTRVAAETHLVDWTCYQCRTGREHVCANLRILGVDADGAFAEYMVLPERNAWPSEGLAPEIAAIQEPMGNAVFATFVEEITTATVAVLGCGPIGLMAVAICRFAGASRVFATDVMPHRREMAARMGSDCVLDATGDVVAEIRRETGGVGVDVVLEMSGADAAIHQAFEMVTNGGRVSLLGLPSRPVTLDLNDAIIFRGLRVYGITGRKLWETWYKTAALLREGLNVSPIITHRLPLSRYAEAFDLLAEGVAGKVVLLPQEGAIAEPEPEPESTSESMVNEGGAV
jgi:threonine 3-dehydrogenase